MVAAAAILTAVAGCAGGFGSSPAGPLEKTSVVVDVFPSIDTAGLYIAQMDGLFRAQGLNVTIKFAETSQATVTGIEKGSYDISSADYVTYTYNELACSCLRIIAEASFLQPGELVMLVGAHSRIGSVPGLVGKTISVAAPNDIATLLVRSLLADYGVLPSQVHFKPGVPLPAAGALLAKGLVDAAPVPQPFVSLDEEQYGLQELADLDQGATENFPLQGFAVTQAWATKYPNTLRAFVTALEQGQQIADTDRSAVEKAVEKFLGVPPVTAALISLPEYPLSIDPVRLQRVPDAMVLFGLLPKKDASFRMSSMIG
ncbi:ABC transporter substrate-binding protein [Trebonia sp.]|uniref:ABC transporter substrate-binding protein n=1 Tax=Trebonia sp. TaxID=2767075 RepID=UPI002613B389|nr:ABC transporter substrate-binding protein [Trebonia sp.]